MKARGSSPLREDRWSTSCGRTSISDAVPSEVVVATGRRIRAADGAAEVDLAGERQNRALGVGRGEHEVGTTLGEVAVQQLGEDSCLVARHRVARGAFAAVLRAAGDE